MTNLKKNIRIQEYNFKIQNEMNHFADTQTQKFQFDQKELQQAKGTSHGTKDKAQNFSLPQNVQENKQIKKNVEGITLNQTNISKALIIEFKQMQIKKFKIHYKDQNLDLLNEQQIVNEQKLSPRAQNPYLKTKSNENLKIQRNNQKNFLKSKFIQKESKNDQLQLDLEEKKTKIEKEDLEQKIQKESKDSEQQVNALQYNNQLITYYKQQSILRSSQLNEIIKQLKNQLIENDETLEKQKNSIKQRINAIENYSQKVKENIARLLSNFDQYVKQVNYDLQQIEEKLKKKNIESKSYQNQQSNSQQKSTNRKKIFENKQVDADIQNLNQIKNQINYNYEQNLKEFNYRKGFYEKELDQFTNLIGQKEIKIKALKFDYLQNRSKLTEELENAIATEKICQQDIQRLEQKQELNQNEIKQVQQEQLKKNQSYQNQINKAEQYLNQIIEQKQKNIIEKEKKNKTIKQRTEYYIEMEEIENLKDISQISTGQNQYYSIDEIFDQDKKVMTLQIFNKRHLKNNDWNNILYQPKWLQLDILSQKTTKQQQNEQSLINFRLQLKNQEINAFGEYLNIQDEKIYFTQTKNIRQTYPRLNIFPTNFIEQFKQQFETNKENCVSLILYYLKDYEAIQYQFQLIYKKIAFIINQENQHYYIATVYLENLLIIVYDSLPQQINKYNQILQCLNYLFSTILKQKIEFDIHISPTFPIQNDINKTSYYACIALEYYSQNQINKKYQSYEEILAIVDNINKNMKQN